jgi:hypothetical protein
MFATLVLLTYVVASHSLELYVTKNKHTRTAQGTVNALTARQHAQSQIDMLSHVNCRSLIYSESEFDKYAQSLKVCWKSCIYI